MNSNAFFVEWNGYCPICENNTIFRSNDPWFRDHLFCMTCVGHSIPRERAMMLAINSVVPAWRNLLVHESSPEPRGLSEKLQRECRHYVATQFFTEAAKGSVVGGVRCEDLEEQTFGAESFDIVITQDVMEHVFRPDKAYQEIWRTLKPNGYHIHTTPIYKEHLLTERQASLLLDGSVKHHAPPEYHGNPISDQGSLLTFKYGYDIAHLIAGWARFDVEVRRYDDETHGIKGEFTDVIICRKRHGISSVHL